MVSAPEGQAEVLLRVLPHSTRFQAVLLTETLALNFPQESTATAIPLSQRSVQLLVVRPGELKSRPNIPFHPGLQNTLGMEMTVPFDYPAGPGRLVL